MRSVRNSSGCVYVFEVKYFISEPEIDIVTKTGSSYILDYVSHTGGTIMAVPMFTTSACSIVLMSITLDIVLRLSATVSNRKLLYGACRRKTASDSTLDVAVVLSSAKSYCITALTALHVPQPEI